MITQAAPRQQAQPEVQQRRGARTERPAILFAVPWDQDVGGVASVVGNLATCLRQQGHDIIFVLSAEVDGVQEGTTAWGFPCYRLNLRSARVANGTLRGAFSFTAHLPLSLARLKRIIERHNVQVVNVHYPVEWHVHFALLRKVMGFRLITSVHGSDVLHHDPGHRHTLEVRALLAGSDLVVAPSRVYADAIARRYPHLAGRSTFAHNGIDVEALLHDGAAEPAIAGRYVLCVAALAPHKGVDVLIRAFARVAPQHPDVRLVLVGDGNARVALTQLANELGLADRVDFLGWQKRPRISRLMRDCELLALATRAESFGLVLAEAMACGKPVVASNVGGIPEIVEDGRSGRLVPVDDVPAFAAALDSILSNPALANALGSEGRSTVGRSFQRHHTAERYSAFFDELLN